jgi:hypothetical protein
MKRKELIFNPYFIGGLSILILNDWYLKQEYANYLTGKLSDFAGLLIFPLFIALLGYNCEYYPDSVVQNRNDSYFVICAGGYYQTDNIIRSCSHDSIYCDTIANIKYELTEIKPNKTKLTLINVTISKKGNIQNWRVLKSLSRQYDQWLKDNLIEKIKK